MKQALECREKGIRAKLNDTEGLKQDSPFTS